MKIAEALIRIKDIKGKLASTMYDIAGEQSYEQVDINAPIPNIDPFIEAYCSVSQDLAQLKNRITKTNAKYGLQEKLYRMEALRSTIKQLDGLTSAKQKSVRLGRVDYDGPAVQITTYATYDVAKLDARLEQARAEIRALDLELQKRNWEIDLEE